MGWDGQSRHDATRTVVRVAAYIGVVDSSARDSSCDNTGDDTGDDAGDDTCSDDTLKAGTSCSEGFLVYRYRHSLA